jgi:beta-RFAP synthase
MIRVTAPSRLHFGLFSLPAQGDSAVNWPGLDGQFSLPARAFGGAGLTLQRPGLSVAAEAAQVWSGEGPLAERALGFAQSTARAIGLDRPFRVVVEKAPREHVGLGTGTQLALATARAVTVAAGRADIAAEDLARIVGRGRRSALGIHGFARGGFIVEGGKRSADAVAPLVARALFPAEWRVLLAISHNLIGDHSIREADAFRQLGEVGHHTDALCRLVLLGMLPALAERDLDAFGEALYDFNRRVGEMFRPWQGDFYAHPRVAELVRVLRAEAGARGVGQSSWGPAVFAVVARQQASELADWLVRRDICRPGELIITEVANTGAAVATV